jgi:SMC interacting uncharacterized protein involved in chromosome segregation
MENSTLFVGGIQLVLNWMSHHIVEIIIFLSIFIEVSKIKFSPISSLIKFIFKPIRTEMEELRKEFKQEIKDLKDDITSQIDSLREDQEKEKEAIDELIYSNEMAEISRIRWSIIEFSNSLTNGQLHVRDEYRHMKDEYRKYEGLVEKYDLENGIVTEEIDKINKHYEEFKDTPSVYF